MAEGYLIMVFSEDKILIKHLYVYKGYSARQLISEFPEKGWKLKSFNYLLKKLLETDTVSLTVPIENPEVADHALMACIRARGGHFKHLL